MCYSTLTSLRFSIQRFISLKATCQFLTLSISSACILMLSSHRVHGLPFSWRMVKCLSLPAYGLYVFSVIFSTSNLFPGLSKLYNTEVPIQLLHFMVVLSLFPHRLYMFPNTFLSNTASISLDLFVRECTINIHSSNWSNLIYVYSKSGVSSDYRLLQDPMKTVKSFGCVHKSLPYFLCDIIGSTRLVPQKCETTNHLKMMLSNCLVFC